MKNTTIADEERFFLALADKTRLRLLNLMRSGEVHVNAFVEILGESQPKISRHLAFLRAAGICELRRDGKWIHYRIAENKNDSAARILRNAFDWLASDHEMNEENQKLESLRGSFGEVKNEKCLTQSNVFDETNIKKSEKRELEIYLL